MLNSADFAVVSVMNENVVISGLCDCLLPVSQLLVVDFERLTEALISTVSTVGGK